jgi:hypothetical protein
LHEWSNDVAQGCAYKVAVRFAGFEARHHQQVLQALVHLGARTTRDLDEFTLLATQGTGFAFEQDL